MSLKRYFKLLVVTFYVLLNRNQCLVCSQYTSDYIDFDNTMSNDVRPHYQSRGGRQYEDTDDPIKDEIASVIFSITTQKNSIQTNIKKFNKTFGSLDVVACKIGFIGCFAGRRCGISWNDRNGRLSCSSRTKQFQTTK